MEMCEKVSMSLWNGDFEIFEVLCGGIVYGASNAFCDDYRGKHCSS